MKRKILIFVGCLILVYATLLAFKVKLPFDLLFGLTLDPVGRKAIAFLAVVLSLLAFALLPSKKKK